MPTQRQTKTILFFAAAILIVLNLYTFIAAYPETYTPSPGINTQGTILAKDFSAYYVGAWRLWHNPSHIYSLGGLGDAEPNTPPHPEAYKYLPSFLIITSPFLAINYQQALLAFDIIQFMLLPLMAYMLYKLLSFKHPAITLAVMVIALLLPFPSPNGGLSLGYYWQWGEGQAKVALAFLLLLSFYFGNKGKPVLSGVALAFGFFDVRFGLLALPLFVFYNRQNLKVATLSLVAGLAASNVMLLYSGVGTGFLNMVFGSGITTPLYYYSFIPLFSLVSLILVNLKEVIAALDYKGFFADFTRSSKNLKK
jgi:hypothetical protein